MKTYIVRFKGTPPNHYDAPSPRLITGTDKAAALINATTLAEKEGLQIGSVRKYFNTHRILPPPGT